MSERRNDPQMRVVSAEAVEEFKVQTSAYSAEFGRASNGVLNYTTKSGTNALHGSFMGQLRHEKLNAKGFFWGYAAASPSSASTSKPPTSAVRSSFRRFTTAATRASSSSPASVRAPRTTAAPDLISLPIAGLPQRRLPPLHQRRRPDGAVVRSARRQRQHHRQRRTTASRCSATAC